MLISSTQQLRTFEALRSKPFAILWSGQTISALGDGAFLTAIAVEVFLLTRSATAMAAIVTAEMLPKLAFLLIGGIVADRLPRRLILLSSDATRGLLLCLITVLGLLHFLQFWHLLGLSFLFGIASSFFNPAANAFRPQLVNKEQLASANALSGLSTQMGILLGPMLGAGLIAIATPLGAFAFDGLSFLISAICLFFMPWQPARETNKAIETTEQLRKQVNLRQALKQVGSDLAEGWKFVRHAKWFYIGLPVATIGNMFLNGPLEVSMPKLVYEVYGQGSWLLGAISTSAAVGMIIASLLVGQYAHMPRRGTIMYMAVMLMSAAMLLYTLPVSHQMQPILACFANGCIGFGGGAFGILWVTIMQEKVPGELLGRVSSIDQLGAWSLLPLGYFLSGKLTDILGPVLVFLIGGIINVILAAIALVSKEVRTI
jgi:MFS family permease